MPTIWAVLSLSSLLFAPFTKIKPVEATQEMQARQSGEGVVAGISWRDENGTQDPLPNTVPATDRL